MDKVKVAFCGCGGIAQFHLSHLVQFDDVEYVGFYDIIRSHAEEKAKFVGGAPVYDSLTGMLDTAKPDCMYICVPPAEHGEIEAEILKRSIPFLVEKPMALDLRLAEKILAEIEEKKLITAIGFQDRYLDIVETMRGWLENKQVGLVDGAWVGGIPGVAWWQTYATSGGQIVEQNIHLFDLLRYLFGEPARVYCAAARGIVKREGFDVHDYSSATITFKNDVVATLFTGCFLRNDAPEFPNGFVLHCPDARIDYRLRRSVEYADKDGTILRKRLVDQGVTEDRTFIDAIKTGDPSKIRSPYRDAIKSLRLTLACNESINTGKVVEL